MDFSLPIDFYERMTYNRKRDTTQKGRCTMSLQNDDDFPFDADLISLLDDEGNEYEFEILDEIDYKNGHYYVLLPLFDLPEEDIVAENTYVILESIEDENGEPQLAELDDPELMEELDTIYQLNREGSENNS